MSTVENTCTTLTLHDSEKAKYLSKPMDDLSNLVTSGCDLCSKTDIETFHRVCERGHHLGECCKPRKANWFKICSDRRGDRRVCPVEGCRAEPLGEPKLDAKFTNLTIAARKACEYELHEATMATVRDELRAENDRRVPSRKRKADCTDEEWEAKQAAKRARADAKRLKEKTEAINAKLLGAQKAKLIALMGIEAYGEWVEAILDEEAPVEAPVERAECAECEECEE